METQTPKPIQQLDSVVIRFAGDSGDGMQLTGQQFTNTTALFGNDLATFPDFPAEIRAPAGTRAGVSGFQIHFSSNEVHTPGDAPGVLVAMNPAALVANLGNMKRGGTIIVNIDKFKAGDLKKAALETNPLEDGSLDDFRVIPVQLSSLTREAVKGLGLGTKQADRCKNFFALGISYWLFNRPMALTKSWVMKKFKHPYGEANLRALDAGWNYALTMELLHETYEIPPAKLPAGTYRNITGNTALALGIVAASQISGLKVFLGSYPITPASDILHALSNYKHCGVTTFQAEDEIAAVCAAIGASYGGSIGMTTTSGPGLALKGEALGLAGMIELPLIVVNVQRGGPSTGLPTKTEQSDLLFAMYGRNGEMPLPIIAAATPSDCFNMALEAARITLKYMVPVLLLTDGYLANGAEPWLLPKMEDLPEITNHLTTEHNNPGGNFMPYTRDPETLARPWAVPGTPGLEHRLGGLEKQELTGNVSYDPKNHQRMCEIRQAKVDGIAATIPPTEVYGSDGGTLVLGWGSTYGSIRKAVQLSLGNGFQVAHAHIRHLNPFPPDLHDLLTRYDKILMPEMNLGQLSKLIRMKYLIDVVPLVKIEGQPFKVSEIQSAIATLSA